jgi:hypothetical protein
VTVRNGWVADSCFRGACCLANRPQRFGCISAGSGRLPATASGLGAIRLKLPMTFGNWRGYVCEFRGARRGRLGHPIARAPDGRFALLQVIQYP